MKTIKEIIEGLNDLLKKNYDARDGFKQSAVLVSSSKIRRFLEYKSNQRARFAAAIRDEILLLGGTPSCTGTFEGSFQKYWIDFKALVMDDNEKSILASCEWGEKKAMLEYKEFLKYNAVPSSLRTRLINQQNEISLTLRSIGHLQTESH